MENLKEILIIFRKSRDTLGRIEEICLERIKTADKLGIKKDSIEYREILLNNLIDFLLSHQEIVPVLRNILNEEKTFAFIPMKELVRNCEIYLNYIKKTIWILNSDIFDLTYGENPSIDKFINHKSR